MTSGLNLLMSASQAETLVGSSTARYNLLGANCEQFANYCVTGVFYESVVSVERSLQQLARDPIGRTGGAAEPAPRVQPTPRRPLSLSDARVPGLALTEGLSVGHVRT